MGPVRKHVVNAFMEVIDLKLFVRANFDGELEMQRLTIDYCNFCIFYALCFCVKLF